MKWLNEKWAELWDDGDGTSWGKTILISLAILSSGVVLILIFGYPAGGIIWLLLLFISAMTIFKKS